MELSRRDALVALASGGVVVGSGALALEWEEHRENAPSDGYDDHEVSTLEAVASVVYPSGATGVDEFVETYVVGRSRDRPAYVEGVTDAIETLDGYGRDWFDAPFAALPADRRDTLLHQTGVDEADPDPDGLDPERIRYYLVNELLYAFYTAPVGGRLVGIENPQGHPGGLDSYRRFPDQ